MIVYKYAHDYGVTALRSLELKVTPPGEFNDPFEFLPVVPKLSFSAAKKITKNKDVLRHAYELALASGKFRGSWKEYRAYSLKYSKERAQILIEKQMLPGKFQQRVYAYANETKGILCFSEVIDHILLWSHYADRHRGLALGIDVSDASLQWHEQLWPVVYSDQRVRLALNLPHPSVQLNEAVDRLVATKSSAWQYEKEQRMLFALRDAKKKPLKEGDRTVGEAYFVRITPQSIRKVVLGCRCNQDTEDQVRQVLSQTEFKHVALQHCQLHDSEFQLVII